MIPMTDKMHADADILAEGLFESVSAFHKEHGKPGDTVDSRVVNEAIARVWCAFCGQLADETRQAVLLHFCQVATQELPGDGLTRNPEPGEKPH